MKVYYKQQKMNKENYKKFSDNYANCMMEKNMKNQCYHSSRIKH
jgi:hypothetical protein